MHRHVLWYYLFGAITLAMHSRLKSIRLKALNRLFPGFSHGEDELSYSTDSLITGHWFGGNSDPFFKEGIEFVRSRVDHPLYHRWRLYTAVKLQVNLLQQSIANAQDFVYIECGVGEGHTIQLTDRYISNMSEGIRSLWRNSEKLLFDTFRGVDPDLIEVSDQSYYFTNPYFGSTLPVIEQRLKHIPNVKFVEGSIPDTLSSYHALNIKEASFVHIDMNHHVPETAALEFLAPRMQRGGVILFDDYSFQAASKQRNHINSLCDDIGLSHPLGLPTGQGLLLF